MKLIPAVPVCRGRSLLFLMLLWLGGAPLSHAQEFSWTNPFGVVTVFGSGALTTFLETDATVGSVVSADSLNYLDAGSLPAISQAKASAAGASLTAMAELSVTESQVSGLPYSSGSIDFTATGGGGSGSGAITLYFLIQVPNSVMIDLIGLQSSITTAGSLDDAFSMALFQSDATGAKIGNAVLSLSGNLSTDASYQTSHPYYLLEMNAVANATSASTDTVDFSFFLDLAPVVPVPEPTVSMLLLCALSWLAISHFRGNRLAAAPAKRRSRMSDADRTKPSR